MIDFTQYSRKDNVVYIYVLIDPRNNEIRYVGKTNNPKDRYSRHCRVQQGLCHRACWLNKLRSLNIKPVMQIIEECDESNWAEREIHWIKYYRDLDCNIVNGDKGGRGRKGYTASEETRRKLSESHKGKGHSEETRRKIGDGNKGKIVNEESRRKISEVQKGKTLSDEHKRKISESLKGENNPSFGKSPSEETRHKLSESNKGKTLSKETKRKISESLRRK